MISFVSNLSTYARAFNSSFLIVPQNGEALAEDPAYLAVIDGIGREDLLYGDYVKQASKDTDYANQFLRIMRESGKFVLEVEYTTNSSVIAECYHFAQDQGYLCYVGPRELDQIQINQGFEPD